MSYKKKQTGNQPYYAQFLRGDGDAKKPKDIKPSKPANNKSKKLKGKAAFANSGEFSPKKGSIYGKPDTLRPRRNPSSPPRNEGSERKFDNDFKAERPVFRGRSEGNDRSGNDRPYKPRFEGGDRNERPAFRGRSEGGDRNDRPAFKPRFEGGDRNDRPAFKPRSEGGDRNDRPYKPRFEGGDRNDRPYKPRSEGGDRNDRPAFRGRSEGNDRNERPYKPRFEGGDRNDRPFKPRFEGGDRNERPAFKPRSEGGDRNDRPYRPRFEGGDRNDRPAFGGRSEGDRPNWNKGRATEQPKRDNDTESRRVGRHRNAPDYNLERVPERSEKFQKEKKNDRAKTDDSIRLNKYIANSGVCSRREADELIEAGQITVNGKTISELGYKVKPTDVIKYGNRLLNPEKTVYLLLNKPKGYITTTDDPEERKTVMDLIEGACKERIYPVGRLDRNTTGLLLFTNDGELAEKLMHPSNEAQKIYQAELDKPITPEDFEKIKAGLELEDGFVKPDDIALVTPDAEVVGIEIHSGKNRIVRRIFEHLGYDVQKLDRTVYAGLNKKELPRGKWRFLNEREVVKLKYLL